MSYDPNRKFEMSAEYLSEDEMPQLTDRINGLSEDQLKWLVLGFFGIVNPLSEMILPHIGAVNEEICHATKSVVNFIYFGPIAAELEQIVEQNYEAVKPQSNAKNN